MLHIKFYMLPLLSILAINILMVSLTLHLFIQTKKKQYLSLSITYLITSAMASSVVFGQIDHAFSRSFMLLIIGMIISVVAIIIMWNSKNKIVWLSGIILSVLSLLSLFLPGPLNSLATSLLMLAYGIFSLVKKQWTGNINLHISLYSFFILLGFLGTICSLYTIEPILLIFSLVALFQMILSVLLFFDRVVMMMKVASFNSVTDPLTGIYNKRFLLHKVKQLAKVQEISIIFADIDNFKQLNDTRGHDEGDRILREVGRCLKQTLQNNGYACRFGGEEMVGIVVKGKANEYAEEFRLRVENEVGVTVSVGVASGMGDGGEIIKIADKCMYEAKATGKNKVIIMETIA